METDNNTLINELGAILDVATGKAKRFRSLSETQLNFKELPEKWSILECIEHLNRYGDYYLPEIEKAILLHKSDGKLIYKSGVIGNYFANLMKVNNGRIVKMRTPTDKNPLGSTLNTITIDRFLKQQEMLRSLLEKARHTDLTRTKVPISLTKFMKLRLGDTLRFLVNHIERHIIQAENTLRSKK
jgi:hypothetical protein